MRRWSASAALLSKRVTVQQKKNKKQREEKKEKKFFLFVCLLSFGFGNLSAFPQQGGICSLLLTLIKRRKHIGALWLGRLGRRRPLLHDLVSLLKHLR